MLAALVAITAHVVAELAVSREPFIEHPDPVVAKLTLPLPEPPLVERFTWVPKTFVNAVLEIFRRT
jgi:hypothetical protein